MTEPSCRAPRPGRRRQRRAAAVRRRGAPSRAGRCSRWTGASRPAATRRWSRRCAGCPARAPSDRRGQRRGAAPARHRRAAARRRRAGRRRRARPGRPHAAALRARHRAGRRLRPAAPLDARRRRRRGLGRRRRRRRRPAGLGRGDPDAGQRARRGGPDGHRHRARPRRSGSWAWTQGGTTAFAPIGQGPGDVAWFGRDTARRCERLVFLRDAVAPVLSAALRERDPVDVFSLAAQARRDGRRRPRAHAGRDQPADPAPAPGLVGRRPSRAGWRSPASCRRTTCSSSPWRWPPRGR